MHPFLVRRHLWLYLCCSDQDRYPEAWLPLELLFLTDPSSKRQAMHKIFHLHMAHNMPTKLEVSSPENVIQESHEGLINNTWRRLLMSQILLVPCPSPGV
jgi:hypothetical protein